MDDNDTEGKDVTAVAGKLYNQKPCVHTYICSACM